MTQKSETVKLEETWITFLIRDLGDLHDPSPPVAKVPIKREEDDPQFDIWKDFNIDTPEPALNFPEVISSDQQKESLDNFVLETAVKLEF